MAKNPHANARDPGSTPRLGRFPWRRKWQPILVFLPGKSHGQRSLAGSLMRVRHDLATKQEAAALCKTRALTRSICTWYKYSHCGWFQAITPMALDVGVGRDAQQHRVIQYFCHTER